MISQIGQDDATIETHLYSGVREVCSVTAKGKNLSSLRYLSEIALGAHQSMQDDNRRMIQHPERAVFH
jgi:hypothetical protein